MHKWCTREFQGRSIKELEFFARYGYWPDNESGDETTQQKSRLDGKTYLGRGEGNNPKAFGNSLWRASRGSGFTGLLGPERFRESWRRATYHGVLPFRATL